MELSELRSKEPQRRKSSQQTPGRDRAGRDRRFCGVPGGSSDLLTPARHTALGVPHVAMTFPAKGCFCLSPEAAGLSCGLTEKT